MVKRTRLPSNERVFGAIMEIESLCVSNTNGEMLTIQHGGYELTVMSIGNSITMAL